MALPRGGVPDCIMSHYDFRHFGDHHGSAGRPSDDDFGLGLDWDFALDTRQSPTNDAYIFGSGAPYQFSDIDFASSTLFSGAVPADGLYDPNSLWGLAPPSDGLTTMSSLESSPVIETFSPSSTLASATPATTSMPPSGFATPALGTADSTPNNAPELSPFSARQTMTNVWGNQCRQPANAGQSKKGHALSPKDARSRTHKWPQKGPLPCPMEGCTEVYKDLSSVRRHLKDGGEPKRCPVPGCTFTYTRTPRRTTHLSRDHHLDSKGLPLTAIPEQKPKRVRRGKRKLSADVVADNDNHPAPRSKRTRKA